MIIHNMKLIIFQNPKDIQVFGYNYNVTFLCYNLMTCTVLIKYMSIG